MGYGGYGNMGFGDGSPLRGPATKEHDKIGTINWPSVSNFLVWKSDLSHAENLPPRKLKLRSRKLCVSFGVSQTFPGYVISMLRKQSLQWRKVA